MSHFFAELADAEKGAVTAEVRAALGRLRGAAARLVTVFCDEGAGEDERAEAEELLVEMGSAAASALVDRFRQGPGRERKGLGGILRRIGEPAVEPLLVCLAEADAGVRAAVAFLFADLYDPAGRADQPLIDLLDDADEMVRQMAAFALGARGCRRAVPRLIALATRPIEVPRRDLDPEGWLLSCPHDCRAAVEALGRIGDHRAVPPLVFLVETQGVDGPMYEEAVRALALLRDERGADVLERALEDERSRTTFANALATFYGPEAIGPLLDLATSESPWDRRAVCKGLISLGEPSLAEFVADLLVDFDEGVREDARAALSQTIERRTVDELIAGLEDPSPDVRAWAVGLLPLACAWSD